MKKMSKRVLSITLALILCLSSMYVVFGAETVGCFNKFSDTVYDFSGFKTTSNGALDSAFDNGGYLFKHHSNTNAYNTVKGVVEDGKTALELAHGVNGDASYIQPQTYNDQSNTFKKAHISFSIKITGNDTDPFSLTFREPKAESVGIVTFKNSKIRLFNQDSYDYSLNTWYDIDVRVDLTSNWGYFKIREQGETQWTEFERFYDKLISPQNSSAYSCTSSFWIAWQYLGKSAKEAKVYLTDLMQDTDDGTMRVTASNNFDTSSVDDWYRTWSTAANHAIDGIQASSNTTLDSRYYWLIQNGGTGKASVENRDVDGDGDLECVLTTSAGNNTQNVLRKMAFGNDGETTNRTHVIRFKMGISTDEALRYFGVRFYGGKEYEMIRMYNGQVKLATASGTFTNKLFTAKANKLYDCEVIYDANAKICIASVTDEEGKQYTSNVSLSSYDVFVGPFFSAKGYSSSPACDLYIDDFSWETMPAAASIESAGIGWDNDTDASLDESVVITCSETLNQEQNIGSAGTEPSVSVEITENGAPVQIPYSLSTEANKLFVNLMDLEPGAAYVVTVSGIKTLRGDSLVVPVSVSFNTTQDSITATEPTKAGNIVSTTVDAPYVNGKKAMLVIGVYDASGKLIDVINKVGLAKRGENSTITMDVSAYSGAAMLRAFVWSDYNTLIPYSTVGDFKN